MKIQPFRQQTTIQIEGIPKSTIFDSEIHNGTYVP